MIRAGMVLAFFIVSQIAYAQTRQPYHIYAGNTHAHTQYTWSHGEQWAKGACSGILVYSSLPDSPFVSAWTGGYVKGNGKCPAIYVVNGLQYPAPGMNLRPDWETVQGPPSRHFELARQDGFNFYVTSDHSQEALFWPNTPNVPAWKATKEQAAAATGSNFVAIAGFEYSENDGPNGEGHINVMNSSGILDALAPGIDLPYFYKWLAAEKPDGDGPVVASFNHPGPKQYNDWAYRTPAVTNIITMLEVINSNNKIHYEGFIHALDKGWKVSPVSGRDNHGTTGITRTGSRTFVLATARTKRAILEAMKERRTYASLDTDLQCRYSVNGQVMGSTLRPAAKYDFDIDIADPDTNDETNKITRASISFATAEKLSRPTPRPNPHFMCIGNRTLPITKAITSLFVCGTGKEEMCRTLFPPTRSRGSLQCGRADNAISSRTFQNPTVLHDTARGVSVLMKNLLALSMTLMLAIPSVAQPHTFQIGKGVFTLDGKPFQLISGEMHYPRIPRAAWRGRLRMAKAMGLNSITAYVFWNEHEPRPGQFDFSGNNDVAEFVREAQQEGLWVILRPGPYVCAEWEFGGFPAWLQKNPGVRLRTTDPRYMKPVKAYLKRLGQELAPLQASRGGPIVAVQVENEYGSYGNDRDYMRAMRKAIIDAGFDRTLLFSTDGAKQIANDKLPDMFSAVNFGPGKSDDPADPRYAPRAAIEAVQRLQPGLPVLVGEYWDGWFDHYGSPWQYRDAQRQAEQLEWMLKKGYSVSLYMFTGGTSFGWMNGANSSGPNDYEPDVTSYDYDAVLPEDGIPGAKFALFRNVIARVTGEAPPAIPAAPKLTSFPRVPLDSSISLWKTLPPPQHSATPLSMEDVDQAYGYILYRTQLAAPVHGELHFDELHQFATVYVNGKEIGTVDRRLDQHSVMLNSDTPGAQLDILVENSGRINFGPRIQGERIGILGDVTLANRPVHGWDIFSLPMTDPESLSFGGSGCTGPCFYRAHVDVLAPTDTYLDVRELKKGEIWVNGKNLGRFWSVGPQGSLFLPASWLHPGANEIIVFDLEAAPGRGVQGLPKLIKDFGTSAARMQTPPG